MCEEVSFATMDNNDVDFGEELRQLTRPKSLQKLKGELDYEDWVFTAQGKLEKAGLWHIDKFIT